jgi:DNA-binding response OmpR family regulator
MCWMKEQILVVEDEQAIAAFVQTSLEREGFSVSVARSGEAALAQIQADPPQLVVLDLMLPGIDGFEVCRRVRQHRSYIPLIMLTSRTDDVDKIVGLELGADDYVTKPFNARELIARIRSVLRLIDKAGTGPDRDQLQIGDLVIDRSQRVVTLKGQSVNLPPKEFDLLATLAWERGKVFGREMLLERVWGYDYAGESRTVDVHIQRLRSKIEPAPAQPRYLLTVYGIGYKFASEEDL